MGCRAKGQKPAAAVTEQDMGPDVKSENESPLRLFGLQKSGREPLSQGTRMLSRPKSDPEGPEEEDIHRAGGYSGGYLQGDTQNPETLWGTLR